MSDNVEYKEHIPTIYTPPEKKSNLFQPGHTGFKPKGITEMRNAARGMTQQMMQVIIDIAQDEEERGSVRIAAADMVLTRAWGKADAHHDKDPSTNLNPSEMTSAQIMEMLESIKGIDPASIALEAPEPKDTLSEVNSIKLEVPV